jgi:signal transduction histidine kinase
VNTKLWKTYFLGWIPLFLIYAIATNNDWDFSKGFNFLDALFGATWGIGPAVLLLTLLWPITGWMERQNMSALRMVLNHVAIAVLFSIAWHSSIYWFLYLFFGAASAQRSRDSWFIWQSMWGMMLYAAVAGSFHAYRAVEKLTAQARATAEAQALLSKAELAALRNKLNPHFLFNTLHSILALVRKDSHRAEDALLRFSDMLRYLLDTEKLGDDRVTLRQELDFTRDYLALESLRLGERLEVKWDIDERLLCHTLPALTLQPLVENSIKHAFNPRCEPGVLQISVREQPDNEVEIVITDDGPGAEGSVGLSDQQSEHQGSGLGLKTVQKRLALAFGGDNLLEVSAASATGYCATVHIPMTV